MTFAALFGIGWAAYGHHERIVRVVSWFGERDAYEQTLKKSLDKIEHDLADQTKLNALLLARLDALELREKANARALYKIRKMLGAPVNWWQGQAFVYAPAPR